MARRGRKPKTIRLRLLCGDRPDRVKPFLSGPVVTMPVMPRYLDVFARAEWRRMVKQLEKRGTLDQLDGPLLELYCVAYSRYRLALKELAKDGLLVSTAVGGTKTHPAVAIAAQAEKAMAELLEEFGITPSTRTRFAQSRPDALSEFLAKREKP
jgi:P27 family predicted phage terminase small subunit